MILRVATFVLLSIACRATFCQKLHLVIVDKDTREPLPFGTVKLKNRAVGFYANERGELSFPYQKGDTILASYVGYQQTAVAGTLPDTLFLSPIAARLAPVEVVYARPIGKPIKVGLNQIGPRVKVGSAVSLEFAVRVFIGRISSRNKILRIVLPINKSRNDANPVRLHLYAMGNDSLPGEELLPRDLTIRNAEIRNGKLDIDISGMNIISHSRNIFVGVEFIGNGVDVDRAYRHIVRFARHEEVRTYSRTIRDKSFQWVRFDVSHDRDWFFNLLAGLIIQPLE